MIVIGKVIAAKRLENSQINGEYSLAFG